MDETRFDDLSRRLGAAATRRAGLKAALGVLLAGAGIAAGMEADAKNRRKRCRPACGAAQACVDRQCTCPNGGTVCGANCCLTGQACENGRCVAMPDPGACVAFGQACKNVGVPCCEGFVCGSGQGGEGDVACYVPAGGPCATTSDCTFGSRCVMGQCVANPQPQPTPPTPACTPNVPVTGDPVADGAALKAAFAAAALQPDSVISLGTGDYLLADLASDDAVLWDQDADVTVQACPDQVAVVRATGNGTLFRVTNGSMTFVGPGLSITGVTDGSSGTVGVLARDAGTARLRNVSVTDHLTAVYLQSAGTVAIEGGAIRGNPKAFVWDDDTDPATLSCTSTPSITGVCDCGSGSNCETSPPNGTCCPTWT